MPFRVRRRHLDLDGEMAEVDLAKAGEVAGESAGMPCAAAASARIHASVRPAIGMPLKGVGDAEHFFERARHRPPTGAAGEYKRTVDVEKDECGGASALSLRCERCRRAVPWPTAPRRS